MEHLETNDIETNECNICYQTPSDRDECITLDCCNGSKKICVYCIHCLTTPICPYCRTNLPSTCVVYMKETNNISRSEPIINQTISWSEFLEEENIINPYLYDDSRRLRRQIRRLRHEYSQRRSRPNRQERRRQHTNVRQDLHLYSRDAMQNYNRYQDLFIMDDI
mgnify:CR=1 FL=1|tara:strand:+ start:3665 stop:4159 length:495 start_codon:yes stop_codon:yes gene_type:complete